MLRQISSIKELVIEAHCRLRTDEIVTSTWSKMAIRITIHVLHSNILNGAGGEKEERLDSGNSTFCIPILCTFSLSRNTRRRKSSIDGNFRRLCLSSENCTVEGKTAKLTYLFTHYVYTEQRS